MHSFSGFDIELTKGDTLAFAITFSGRVLPNNAQAVFTVKKRVKDTTALIEKTYTVTDNRVMVELAPEDTAGMKAGTYWWDVRVKTAAANGTDVRTPMEYAAFQILEVIGA